MRYALLALLLGCERADSVADGAPVLIAPEAPPLGAIRSSSTTNEPLPRAAPIAPDLVGLPRGDKRWFLALTAAQRHTVRQICRAQRKDPCLGVLRPAGADRENDAIAALGRDRFALHEFCFRSNGGRERCNTPLVLAFDGQPITFASSPGRFAFAREDEPVATDWPTAETPWLALDRDGDGAITSGAELFGDTTRHGFDALAALDDNRDGVIDRRDAAFDRLLLWADTNADRASSRDELRPLADIVTEIPLAYDVDRRCVRGNCEGERGTFTWRTNDEVRTGAVVDIYLRSRM